jgi:hypothetical protein
VSFKLDGSQVYADVTMDIPALKYGVWSAEGDAVVFSYDGDTITGKARSKTATAFRPKKEPLPPHVRVGTPGSKFRREVSSQGAGSSLNLEQPPS